jgi:hypothetical protein
MKYALLICVGPDAYDGLADAEREAITGEYMAISTAPHTVAGAELQPADTATTVRSDGNGGVLTTDGPFADTKEVFGGWFVVEADDLDGALEVAGRIPAVRMGGCVEVRPIVEQSS